MSPMFWMALTLAASVLCAFGWLAGFLSARPSRPSPVGGPDLKLPVWWRLTAPLIDPVAAHLAPWVSARNRFQLQERLRRAGLESAIDPERFMAARLVAGACASFGVCVLCAPLGVAPLSLVVGAAFLGFLMPQTWLSDRIKARQQSLLRALPFFLDVITLAVESGLNLASALGQAVDKGPAGPLRDEFERVLRDIRAGRQRAEALRAMAERLMLPAVGSLVSALIVAEQQGGALAPILRAQAEQRRNERFQRAEKLAMEAPVKMLLPLLAFIFPCTFAVLMFPVIGRMLMEGWLK